MSYNYQVTYSFKVCLIIINYLKNNAFDIEN